MDLIQSLFKYEIVHLNIRSARSNKHNIEVYLAEMNYPEIICLNETKLPKDATFKIEGYNIASRREHSLIGGSRGSMILTREDIKDVVEINEVKEKFKFDEVIGIKIQKSQMQPGIQIFTYYNPPLTSPNLEILQYLASINEICILTGDLNCKNTHWGSSRTDRRGIDLLNEINRLNLVTFNNDSTTRCDPVTGKEESLDVIIGNLAATQIYKEFWVGYDIGSDHYPVHLTLQFKPESTNPPCMTRKPQKMNYKKWQKTLDQHGDIGQSKNAVELEKNAETITSKIREAFEYSCPLTTIRKKPKCRFSPEIEAKVKEKRKLRREKNEALKKNNLSATRQIMTKINRLGNEIKLLQKTEQKQKFYQHCQSLNTETNPKKFFDTFKLISDPIIKETPSTTSSRPVEDEDGNRAAISQEKATLFANRLQKIHKEPNNAGFCNEWKTHVNQYLSNNEKVYSINMDETYSEKEVGDESSLCQPVTIAEFEENLGKCKTRSAVGQDGVSYFLLKKLPTKTKQSLINIFSDAIRLGYFPKVWKTALIKMIPKPNKDLKYAKSYRPISLLSCVGKLLERIIASRVSGYMEEKKLFSKSQSGFRRHHMTTEQLLRLSEESYTAFKKRQTVTALFLDAEAAFDKCWHNGIKYKLKKNLKLPDRMVRLISSFLSDRTLTVLFEGCSSHEVFLEAGTPQGSPLSPLIYIIYVNDYPESINCSLSQFADDTALWTRSYTRAQGIRTLQKSLNELESWCRRWRVKLNGEKSNLLFISRCREKESQNHALHLFNDLIRPVKTAKFLGIEIDSQLSFEKHIDGIQNRTTKRMNVLKVLARNNVKPECLLKLYKCYIRSVIEYGSAAFIATTSKQFDRLSRIQNEAIRVCLQLPRYIRTNLLQEYAGIPNLKNRVLTLNKTLLTKMKAKNTHIAQLCETLESNQSKTLKSPIDILSE